MTKQEILRLAYVTNTSERLVRKVLLDDVSGAAVMRMSKPRSAIAEELKRARPACG